MAKEPHVKVEPPTKRSSGGGTLASSGPDDPFVIMLSSPAHLEDPTVFEDIAKTIAQLDSESHKPRLAFTEHDELTDADIENVRELARKSGVKEISVHGRRAE
jgi:EAL domain-containing protein (putative c-di-GMP-specific phosphodiesterase class I)